MIWITGSHSVYVYMCTYKVYPKATTDWAETTSHNGPFPTIKAARRSPHGNRGDLNSKINNTPQDQL